MKMQNPFETLDVGGTDRIDAYKSLYHDIREISENSKKILLLWEIALSHFALKHSEKVSMHKL